MDNKKSLLVSIGLGLAIFPFGRIDLALGADIPGGTNSDDTGATYSGKIFDPVNEFINPQSRRSTDVIVKTTNGVNILISQDVFETIITSKAAGSPEKNPEQIEICLTNSCGLRNSSSSNSISIHELAKFFESNLNQALNDLVAAQQAESDGTVAADNSRQIVRSESDAYANCGCIPGETKIVRELTNSEYSSTRRNVISVSEARQIVETKLEESSTFVEQINQFKPENSLW